MIIQRIKEWMQIVYESGKRGYVISLTAFVHLSETRCKVPIYGGVATCRDKIADG